MSALKLLVLLLVANGAPIIARRWLRQRLNQALDGGLILADGRPLFGPSKTVRGIIAALIATTLAAHAMHLPWYAGALAAIGAMMGDLLSSFLKRRLDIRPSGRALGLDQIPESLVPALALQPLLSLSHVDIAAVVASFFALELLLSRLLYRIGIRQRPY